MKSAAFRQIAIIAAVVLVCGMLGLYRAKEAVSQPPKLPFSNSVEQRAEMIRELREIRKLLEEQNRILRKQITVSRANSDDHRRTTSRRPSR